MEEYILKHAEEGYVKAVDVTPTAITFTYTSSREYARRFSGHESWNVVGKLAGLEVEPATCYYLKTEYSYLMIKCYPNQESIEYSWVNSLKIATAFRSEEDALSVQAALKVLDVLSLQDWIEIEEV